MTETKKKPDHMKDFIKHKDRVAELEDIIQRTFKGATSNEQQAYGEEFRKVLGEIRPDFDYGANLRAGVEDYNKHVDMTRLYAHDTLERNLDEIVDNLSTDTLDNLIKMDNEKNPTVIGTHKADPDIMRKYMTWKQTERRKDNFESDSLDSKGMEEVKHEVARRYAKEYIEALKKKDEAKGLRKSDQWYVEHENLTQIGALKHMKDEKFKKIASEMLHKSSEAAKKEYQTLAEDKERDMYAVVRDGTKYLAKLGGEQFERVASNLYRASKSNQNN